MPVYMKFPGINGSVTYDNSKGWIELQSAQLGQHRSVGTEREKDSKAPVISEIIATKYQDSTSTDLFKEALSGREKEVTIVFVKDGQEYLRITLKGTLISSYNTSGAGGGDRPLETFTLNFTEITFTMGSPAHASLMVRPQDWGSIHAMAEFNRSAKA